LFGGLAGADCHHGFSGTGAAIGAGVGFTLGAIAGESNRRSAQVYGTPYYGPVAYAQPGYGYAYVTAPSCPPAPRVATPARPAAKRIAKPAHVAKPPLVVVQIPDAPRV